MTNIIHTNNAFRNVGMIEVVNEPTTGHPTLVSEYYPTAYSKIREVEKNLGTDPKDYLSIQFMDKTWGTGDASQIENQTFIMYDNHCYLRWNPGVALNHDAYIQASLSENIGSDGDTPVIVGEWSLSPWAAAENSSVFEVKSGNNSDFYSKWFSAQVTAYEKQDGWIFWSWKTELDGDYRWSYKDGVEAGIIPKVEKSVTGSIMTNSTGACCQTSRPSSARSLRDVDKISILILILAGWILISL
jgi:glucan endo-1,6-beta-glucosidase